MNDLNFKNDSSK